MDFEVTILGANSAAPAHDRNQTAQFLSYHNQAYLIDCGEGAQMQLRKYKIKFSKINKIFISHLHGDHYLGLVGLLSTFHLLGRTTKLELYGPPGLIEIITTQLLHSNTHLNYYIDFKPTDPSTGLTKVTEDKYLEVYSFPLNHRVPCTGFLFKEKPKLRSLIKEKLPTGISIAEINRLRNGEDIYHTDGTIKYLNKDYTKPAKASRVYAYCSDTAYDPSIVTYIKGSDLLYHEATFMQEMVDRAHETLHSTTLEAAQIAQAAEVKRLIIGHYSIRYKDLDPLINECRTIFENSDLALEGHTYAL